VHVERASLLAEDAALRQAVRIFATAFGRSRVLCKGSATGEFGGEQLQHKAQKCLKSATQQYDVVGI
jgi:hypothetical protein